MVVLVCPDKFKGSLTAAEAGAAIARGVRIALPGARVIVQPLADGGEGSLELFAGQPGLKRRRLQVPGPLRRPVEVEYLLGKDRAYIETAVACGLHLVPAARRHPGQTTTLGVGTLLEDALSHGVARVTLMLGGSATNDCGAGMAAALGYRFYSREGYPFVPSGDSLWLVDRIDSAHVHAALRQTEVVALCDVDNPLLGQGGATYTYAAQKGAATEDLAGLEKSMDRFADLLERDLGRDVRTLQGGGAAGGLGAGAIAFLSANLRRGTEGLFSATGFDRLARGADLIITGEGKIDRQTLHGKVVAGVLRHGRPTLAVCGRSELKAEVLGSLAVLALDRQPGAKEADLMNGAAVLLEEMVGSYLTDQKHREGEWQAAAKRGA